MKRLTCVLVLVMSCLCLFATHRPVVALVLSGGGARGFAHIPIIEELERRGIVPDMVIGASMGALVGALYASGYTSQDMYALIDDTDFMNAVFNLSQPAEKVLDRAYDSIGDPNFSIDFTEGGIGRTDALLDDSKVNLILHESLSRVEDIGSFDDLAIPFRCVGTDFRSGEGIVFSSGSLYDALRASMSMPFVFPVVQLEDGRYVVDGGVYDNLPIELARSMGADIVIAVDVNESIRQAAEDEETFETLSGALTQYLVLVGQIRSVEQYDDADYVIVPDTSRIGVVAFNDIDAILECGRAFVEDNRQLFDDIQARLEEAGCGDRPAPRPYSSFPVSTIEGFDFDEDLERFEDLFERLYTGAAYDGDVIRDIDRRLGMIRRMTNKSTVNYRLEDGIVRVAGRDYVEPSTSLQLGLKGGIHSYTDFRGRDFHIALDPDFSLSLDMWFGDLRLTPSLVIGQMNTLSLDGFLLFSRSWALEVGLEGAFGGMSALSDRVYLDRYPTRDWKASGSLGLVYFSGISHRLDLTFTYDFHYLGRVQSSAHVPSSRRDIWPGRIVHHPHLTLSYRLDGTHLESVQETGLSVQCALSVGWDGDFTYSMRGDIDSSIRLSASHSSFLDAGFSLFSSRGPYELLSSYMVDTFGRISSDFIYADMSYRYYFFPRRNGLYIFAGVFGEALSDDGVSTSGRVDDTMVPFATLDSFEAGLVAGLGFLTDFGDIFARVHVSYTGRVSFTIEVQ